MRPGYWDLKIQIVMVEKYEDYLKYGVLMLYRISWCGVYTPERYDY